MGWADVGCNGSPFYETPNIDRLAAEGIRFTNAYAAAPVCSPTRASILTGKSPARLNLTDWIPGRQHEGGRPDEKLIEFYEDQRVELYDLADDLGEKRDLSGQLREKTAALRKALREWRSAVNARMPGVNPDYRRARDPS